MKKCFLAILVTFFVVTVGCTVAPQSEYRFSDNPGNVVHLQRATVALVEDTEEGISAPRCTAFYVAPRKLATALHCVEDNNVVTIQLAPGLIIQVTEDRELEPTLGREILFVDLDEQNRLIENWTPTEQPRVRHSTVIAIDEDEDIAILELSESEPSSRDWLELASWVRPGEHVYVMGMPRSQFWILTEGLMSAIQQHPDGSQTYMFQAPIAPGSSGSPVINERGQVIAVAVRYVRDAGYLGMGTPFHELRDLLREGRQEPPPPPPEIAETEEVPECNSLTSCEIPDLPEVPNIEE